MAQTAWGHYTFLVQEIYVLRNGLQLLKLCSNSGRWRKCEHV